MYCLDHVYDWLLSALIKILACTVGNMSQIKFALTDISIGLSKNLIKAKYTN